MGFAPRDVRGMNVEEFAVIASAFRRMHTPPKDGGSMKPPTNEEHDEAVDRFKHLD